MRIWILFKVARLLRVPIDIHGSFFRRGKKDLNMPKGLAAGSEEA